MDSVTQDLNSKLDREDAMDKREHAVLGKIEDIILDDEAFGNLVVDGKFEVIPEGAFMAILQALAKGDGDLVTDIANKAYEEACKVIRPIAEKELDTEDELNAG